MCIIICDRVGCGCCFSNSAFLFLSRHLWIPCLFYLIILHGSNVGAVFHVSGLVGLLLLFYSFLRFLFLSSSSLASWLIDEMFLRVAFGKKMGCGSVVVLLQSFSVLCTGISLLFLERIVSCPSLRRLVEHGIKLQQLVYMSDIAIR